MLEVAGAGVWEDGRLILLSPTGTESLQDLYLQWYGTAGTVVARWIRWADRAHRWQSPCPRDAEPARQRANDACRRLWDAYHELEGVHGVHLYGACGPLGTCCDGWAMALATGDVFSPFPLWEAVILAAGGRPFPETVHETYGPEDGQ